MMTFTGAVKILFGVIPGLMKAEYHLKMPNIHDFANLLVDICKWVKPTLNIMDGIVGMEGDGPSIGKPRNIGALLISTDPFALDVAACSLIGLKPSYVPTIQAAQERGLTASLDEIALMGDSPGIWNIQNFTMPKSIAVNFIDHLPIPNVLNKFIVQQVRPFPSFSAEMCISCGDCLGHCPPQAIKFDEKKKPQVDLQSCIRCFCCQELCPQKAVNIKKPLVGRFLFR
jgi:ferredoxin